METSSSSSLRISSGQTDGRASSGLTLDLPPRGVRLAEPGVDERAERGVLGVDADGAAVVALVDPSHGPLVG